MKIWQTILLVVPAGYAALIGILYLEQGRLLYHPPETARRPPASVGFSEAEELALATADGEKLVAWYVPPEDGKPLVMFFHGNAEALSWRVPRFRELTEDGTGLLAVSFRGYGGSTGTPSEAGLVADGEAAYAFAAAHYPPERIVLWGYSLGSGVAVQIAARHPVGRLILEAPYYSIVDVAAAIYPFVPVRWLMRDQFHSERFIQQVHAPLLIMHGDQDRVVPVAFGEKLFALANEPKQFVHFSRGGHINLDDFGVVGTVRRFLSN